jgi:predicted DNA-binding transcriptional regulator AlpA
MVTRDQLRVALASKGTSFVDFAELQSRWPVSRRTVYRAIADKRLPRPKKISHRKVGWPREMIEEFLANLTSA